MAAKSKKRKLAESRQRKKRPNKVFLGEEIFCLGYSGSQYFAIDQ